MRGDRRLAGAGRGGETRGAEADEAHGALRLVLALAAASLGKCQLRIGRQVAREDGCLLAPVENLGADALTRQRR